MSAGSCVMVLARSRAYAGRADQIAEARRFLSAILNGCPAADDAVLCLSELATNATLHSNSGKPGGHFTVRTQIHGDRLRVEVRDEGGPWTLNVRRRDGQHGRGLLIVSQLASDWGCSGDSETGWTVWFVMDVPNDCLPLRPPRNHHRRTRRTQHPHTPHPGDKSAMTEPSPAAPAGRTRYDTQDMRAIQAGLAASGLTTHLTDARAGLDLTATLRPSAKHDAEFWIDEDGYAELRYWNPPGTPPAQVTATAIRALQAVTSTPPDPGPHPML
jgi:serine/threonine-protein kinase RsbW